jgi:D-alanyl-D-alanine carboxypeptidase (penicillin-binding protein 5/6)
MKKLFLSIFCFLICIVSSISCLNIGTVYAEDSGLSIDAKSAFLMDFDSGDILYEQNADERLPVASIVKLMTILITLEEIESGNLALDEKLTTTENASGRGGSQVFIDPYVDYTVEEMLKSVIVASANDASVALAERISGSEEVFVKKMNNRAKSLGLENTVYINASGLPEPGQYSTARDVAKLTSEILKHKEYFKYSTIWMDKLIHPSGRETELVNTNKLIRYFKGCDAGKTGSTDEAGYCLSASAERGNMRLIGVVLGSKTGTIRFNETSKLLNYGFSNFENKQIVSRSEPLLEIEVLKSKIKSVPVYASEDYYGVVKKGESVDFAVSVDIPNKVKAPLASGDKVGTVTISKNGVVVKKIDLVVEQNIDKLTYLDGLKEIISKW